MAQMQAIHINPVTIKKDKMDNELKNILQKAKKATALWFISYIVEFLRITGIVSGGRTEVMLVSALLSVQNPLGEFRRFLK